MSNKNIVFGILADRPIAYHPDVARVCGGVKAGIFLSQLLYWSGKGKRRDDFIWKTQDDWESETALTRREQETARKQLKERGILEEKLYGVPATLHYKINFDELYKLLDVHYRQFSMAESAKLDCTNQPNKVAQNGQTIPESTKENTIDDSSRIFSFYENNIGGMSAMISNLISAAVDEHSGDTVLMAMEEAVKNNVRKWTYVEAILKNWKQNGRVKPGGMGNANRNGLAPIVLTQNEDGSFYG